MSPATGLRSPGLVKKLVSFTRAKMWKQPKCLSNDEWIAKCGPTLQWNIIQS